MSDASRGNGEPRKVIILCPRFTETLNKRLAQSVKTNFTIRRAWAVRLNRLACGSRAKTLASSSLSMYPNAVITHATLSM